MLISELWKYHCVKVLDLGLSQVCDFNRLEELEVGTILVTEDTHLLSPRVSDTKV